MMAGRAMKSRIIGLAQLEDDRLREDVAVIDQFAARDDYSEYSFGLWRSFVLANGSGDKDDVMFRGYEGSPLPTDLGRKVPYVLSRVDEIFHTENLKWVRLFTVQNGIIISHRDFVEFSEPFIRVHIPIHTDLTCLHSEEDAVFHMRKGEVWYLDASTVHSACSLSGFKRISLCLDFVNTGAPLESLLKRPPTRLPEALRVSRTPLDDDFLQSLYAFGGVVDALNFRDVAGFLAKVHFYRQAHAASCFDWMIDICTNSGNPDLLQKATAFKRFSIEQRALGERFTF